LSAARRGADEVCKVYVLQNLQITPRLTAAIPTKLRFFTWFRVILKALLQCHCSIIAINIDLLTSLDLTKTPNTARPINEAGGEWATYRARKNGIYFAYRA